MSRGYVRRFAYTVIKFLKFNLTTRYAWLQWLLPFEVANIAIGLLMWVFLSKAVGASVLAAYGGDFLSYVILGIMLNSLLSYGIHAYPNALRMLIHGRMGVRGQTLSMIDYIQMSGSPVLAAILGFVLDDYIESVIVGLLYLAVGVALGLRINPSANIPVALAAIVLGVVATSALGLISASNLIVARAWRGTEPLAWFITTMSMVFSGIYFPIEVIPENVRVLSYLLPQTYSVILCRIALINPEMLGKYMHYLYALAVYALVALAVSITYFRHAINTLRREPLIE